MMDSAGVDYVVKLPTGETRVMKHDDLGAAFEAGVIHAASPVLAPGAIAWTTLGILRAESDDSAQSKNPPSLAPTMIDRPASAHDAEERPSLVSRRRRTKHVGLLFAAAAVFAGAIAIKCAVSQTRAREATLAAESPAPPPPAVAVPVPSAFATVEATDPPEPPPPVTAPAKKTKLPGAPARKRKK